MLTDVPQFAIAPSKKYATPTILHHELITRWKHIGKKNTHIARKNTKTFAEVSSPRDAIRHSLTQVDRGSTSRGSFSKFTAESDEIKYNLIEYINFSYDFAEI